MFLGKIKFFLLCAVAFIVTSLLGYAEASDIILLNALVANGTLSEEDAIYLKKTSAEYSGVVELPKVARSFTASFYIQPMVVSVYQTFSGREGETFDYTSMALRRAVPSMSMDLTDTLSFEMSLSITAKPLITNSASIYQKVDTKYLNGTLRAGFFTAPISTEQIESASCMQALDRSIPSNYWGGGDWYYVNGFRNAYNSRLCISGGHVGLLWNGILGESGFSYGIGITNSQGQYLEPQKGNDLAYWLYVRYEGDPLEDLHLYAGINSGYANKLMGVLAADAVSAGECAEYVSTWILNPFIVARYMRDTSLRLEFFGNYMQNGRTLRNDIAWYTTKSRCAMPLGVSVTIAQNFDAHFCDIEPAFRYAHLMSDGRGINPSEVFYGLMNEDGLYNEVDSFYAGVNWYIQGHNVKLVTGYMYANFSGAPASSYAKDSTVNLFAAMFQVRF